MTLIPMTKSKPSLDLCSRENSTAISKGYLLWRGFYSSIFLTCTPFGTECWSADVSCVYCCYTQHVWERVWNPLFDVVLFRLRKSSAAIKLPFCYKLDRLRFSTLEQTTRIVHFRKMSIFYSEWFFDVKCLVIFFTACPVTFGNTTCVMQLTSFH